MGSKQTPESSEVSSQLLIPQSKSCGGNSGTGTSGFAGELQVLSIKHTQEGLQSEGMVDPRAAYSAEGPSGGIRCWLRLGSNLMVCVKERNLTHLVSIHFVPFDYWRPVGSANHL